MYKLIPNCYSFPLNLECGAASTLRETPPHLPWMVPTENHTDTNIQHIDMPAFPLVDKAVGIPLLWVVVAAPGTTGGWFCPVLATLFLTWGTHWYLLMKEVSSTTTSSSILLQHSVLRSEMTQRGLTWVMCISIVLPKSAETTHEVQAANIVNTLNRLLIKAGGSWIGSSDKVIVINCWNLTPPDSSLVPRPPLPASVSCSIKNGGRIYHVMRAVDVPMLMILFSKLLLTKQKITHHVAFLAVDASMDRTLAGCGGLGTRSSSHL